MHKFYFLLLCCALASAGVWQDFNGNYEVYIPPGYPPVIFEQVTSNVPLDGQALKATASSENGAALFIIEGLSNPEEVDTLTFFCRTDTGGDVQIALADSRRITAFESINDYLPENAVSRGWQKAVYPLTTKDINIHDIRKIYVQLIPQEGTGATLYLDDIILEKAETLRPAFQVVYSFDSSTKNIFNDTPAVLSRGANLVLELVSQNHHGATGQSLQCSFETGANPAEIFFPMTTARKVYPDLKMVSFVLRSAQPLTLEFVPETQSAHQSAKYGQLYQARRYRITLRQPNWQKITLPLDDGTDFYGLRVALPARTSGVFYLDNLSLN